MDASRHGLSAHRLGGASRNSWPMRWPICRRSRRSFARRVFGLPLLTWAVRTEAERQLRGALGRPDDFRGLSAMNARARSAMRPANRESRLTVVESMTALRRNPRGIRAPIAKLDAATGRIALTRHLRPLTAMTSRSGYRTITHLYHTLFCRPWRNQNRSAAAPAGSPSTCWRRTADGELVAAAPCYLKSHSRGEYVFDRGWAEAYERAGGSYYPKLQVAVPFTPATGRRLLVRAGPQSPTPSPRAGERPDRIVQALPTRPACT